MGRIPALPRPRRPEQIPCRSKLTNRTGGHARGTDRLNHHLEESHDDVLHHVPGLDPALVLTEPDHGSDAANLSVRAQSDGAGWSLTGEKTSISLGMVADTGVVFARTGGPGAHGVSAFYVNLNDPRIARTALDDHGGRAIGRASLHFDGLPVSPSELSAGSRRHVTR
ncbi:MULTISPECIES: acyl-CoA dehydrogenase family protein [Mycolicibacterium]|uniref:Acyl-CoA oxidase/dehydrogenase middle domain-containing protein n=1 Tax=Mycolicibacterium septicum DSM 44393 TaxID=1341646 RepID=A0A7X6MVM6_9MYCO|nr:MULTISPECIES: acyl-CoA dehydrogenase family protein [Mycolicibacterium]MBX8685942.1 hypothetical protein [Mycobacterium sp. 20091114027_K0903767]NKZ14881.1 hypothetical protein [Mycolicibacterium septicum DSM 44393]